MGPYPHLFSTRAFLEHLGTLTRTLLGGNLQRIKVSITQETLVKIYPHGSADGLRQLYLSEIERGLVRLEGLLMRYRSVADDALYFYALMELEVLKRCAKVDALGLAELTPLLHSVLCQTHTLARTVSEQRTLEGPRSHLDFGPNHTK